MQLMQQEVASLKSQLDAMRKDRQSQEAMLQKQIGDLNQQLLASERALAQVSQQKVPPLAWTGTGLVY
jgi:hypothetical protein